MHSPRQKTQNKRNHENDSMRNWNFGKNGVNSINVVKTLVKIFAPKPCFFMRRFMSEESLPFAGKPSTAFSARHDNGMSCSLLKLIRDRELRRPTLSCFYSRSVPLSFSDFRLKVSLLIFPLFCVLILHRPCCSNSPLFMIRMPLSK